MVDLEAVAALLHQGWMDYQRNKGVAFGPERSATTHPHFVPWQDLDNGSQNQDRFIASVLLRDWERGNLPLDDLPAAIHDAWAEWSRLQGEDHPHALPYCQAHSQGDDEHTRQADLIRPLLKGSRPSHNE